MRLCFCKEEYNDRCGNNNNNNTCNTRSVDNNCMPYSIPTSNLYYYISVVHRDNIRYSKTKIF